MYYPLGVLVQIGLLAWVLAIAGDGLRNFVVGKLLVKSEAGDQWTSEALPETGVPSQSCGRSDFGRCTLNHIGVAV